MSKKEKMTAYMTEKVSPVFQRLGQNKYLQTISASMMGTLGPLIIGSIAVLLLVFPIPAVTNAIAAAGLSGILVTVNSVTIGAMAVYVAFLMAKNLVEKFIPQENGALAGVLALMSFLIMTPMDTTADGIACIPTTWLGAQGVFSAMILGLLVGRIYIMFRQKGWTVKMPDSVPPMVTQMFDSLFPAIAIGVVSIFIARIFSGTTFGSFHQFIYAVIQQPLKGIGGSIAAVIICSLIQQILWFFGIHGTNVIMPIVQALWMSMDVENLTALAAGDPLPNITGYAFFNLITWGGLALGLVMLMLVSKSKQYRELGKVAIVPALFGITEPVIFGTPLVLNFDLAIPFITNNSIAMIIAYLLMKAGIVSYCAGTTPIFGMPIGLYAIVGGSISIIILHLFIQLVLSPVLWFPWFKRVEKRAVALEKAAEAK